MLFFPFVFTFLLSSFLSAQTPINNTSLPNFDQLLKEKFPIGKKAVPYYLIEPLDEVVEYTFKGSVRKQISINGTPIDFPTISFSIKGLNEARQAFFQKNKLIAPLKFVIANVSKYKIKSAYVNILHKDKIIARLNVSKGGFILANRSWWGRVNNKLIFEHTGFYEVFLEIVYEKGISLTSSKKYFQTYNLKNINISPKDPLVVKKGKFLNSPEIKDQLQQLAPLMAKSPNLYVLLISYCDQTSSTEKNKKIALTKLAEIQQYIMKVTKTPQNRFITFGFDSRYLMIKNTKKNSIDMLLSEKVHLKIDKLVRKHQWKLTINNKDIPIFPNGSILHTMTGYYKFIDIALEDQWGNQYKYTINLPFFETNEPAHSVCPVHLKDGEFDPDEPQVKYTFGVQTEHARTINVNGIPKSPNNNQINMLLDVSRSGHQVLVKSNVSDLNMIVNKGYNITKIEFLKNSPVPKRKLTTTLGFSPSIQNNTSKILNATINPSILLGISGLIYQRYGLNLGISLGAYTINEPYTGKKQPPDDASVQPAIQYNYEINAEAFFQYSINRYSGWITPSIGFHYYWYTIENTYDTPFISTYLGPTLGLRTTAYYNKYSGVDLKLIYSPLIWGTDVSEVKPHTSGTLSLFEISSGFFSSWLAFNSRIEYFYKIYWGDYQSEYQKEYQSVFVDGSHGIRIISELGLL